MDYNITYREKDKGWQYIISYKNDSGKWLQKSKQGFRTKKESKLAAEKRLEELKKTLNYQIIENDLSLEELHDIFIKDMSLYRSKNTLDTYTYSYHKFIELKDIKVEKIRTSDLQVCVAEMLRQGLKTSSINSYVKSLKQILKYYKKNYNEAYNIPTCNLILNKPILAKKRAMTQTEANLMLSEMKNKSQFYIVALLCLNLGLRRSEALGVTIYDIDEINMLVKIDKQWIQLKTGGWGFSETKNKKARFVPISSFTLKEIKEYVDTNPVQIDGRIINHTGLYLSQYMNVELKKYNITIHELRHTYVTFLISQGVDYTSVADLIGDTVEQVYKTYSHVTNDSLKKAKSIIQNNL